MRTRSIGTISLSTARIGLIFSAEPIHALAPPMRPPRRRYSSVSMENQSPRSLRVSAAAFSTASRSPPRAAAAAAPSATRPVPPAPVRESKTRTRPSPRPSRSIASTACRAASQVPDSPPEMCTETMSLPASSSGS